MIIQNSKDFHLDLAFTCIEKSLWNINLDDFSTSLLNHAEFWSYELHNWLQLIRSNSRFVCPGSVEKATTLSLGLQFTDDLKIKQLNSHWLNNNNKTDVLSFPVLDDFSLPNPIGCLELGDIFVSIPTAHYQALEHNHEFLYEMRWLVSHGLLHLLGWDHCEEESLTQMLRTQEHLLDLRGIL